MTDSDFTIGFKQGQEHGIQIMQEKIEDIKKEIKEEKENAEIKYGHQLGYEYIHTYQKCLEIIDKHTKEIEQC